MSNDTLVPNAQIVDGILNDIIEQANREDPDSKTQLAATATFIRGDGPASESQADRFSAVMTIAGELVAAMPALGLVLAAHISRARLEKTLETPGGNSITH